MKFRPLFAWYDLWVGVFIDRAKKRIYVFPLPCLGFVIEWGNPEPEIPPQNRGLLKAKEFSSELASEVRRVIQQEKRHGGALHTVGDCIARRESRLL